MLSCAVRLCLALLTLDPFLLLVATSITIALLLIGISLKGPKPKTSLKRHTSQHT